MATPHVSGAVALLATVFPNESVAGRKARILNYADPKASLSGRCVTGARLNLFNSIQAPAIAVTSPNGGEAWMIGTLHDITWTSSGTVGNVNIHYSLDNGSTWTSIISGTLNDGVHGWAIPSVTPSSNCLVRVQETDGFPTDQSNAVFSIVAITTETVSTPTAPAGPVTGTVGGSYTYSTGGSTSSAGHAVQYRFDWGDGTYSAWLAVGTTSASHNWLAGGTFNVRAMARCSTHWIQSAWSAALPVTLGDTPTWAGISRFGASAAESQPTVEWHTSSEMSTVGFNLWRRDLKTGQYELVNPGLLPALPNSPQGGVYRFADPGAQYGEPVVYRLEEIDSLGRTMSYGPFTVTFGAAAWQEGSEGLTDGLGKEVSSDVYGFQRFKLKPSPYEQERLETRRQELQMSSTAALMQTKERARITVKGRGLFYVDSARIASSLGISVPQASLLIAQYKLKLTGMGKSIAWLADGNGAGVFFYNKGLETAFSDRNVYWLERGSGLAMETFVAGNRGPAPTGQSYKETLHFEGNQYALLGSYMNPLSDIWFWDYVEAGGSGKTFAVEVPGAAASGMATLTVNLQGATDTAAEYDHHALVSLNGSEIGDASWSGTKAHSFEIAFDPSLLNEATVFKVKYFLKIA